MAMGINVVRTSAPVATKASKILRDGRYSATAKSVAGTGLRNRAE